MKNDTNFYDKFTEEQQNSFLEKYLTETTKYLTRFEFPNSPGCYYFLPEFRDEQYHDNSIANLASFLLLLMTRSVILPFKFKNIIEINPNTGTPVVYFIFSNWPIGDLHDKDFENFEHVQDDELRQYANILAN